MPAVLISVVLRRKTQCDYLGCLVTTSLFPPGAFCTRLATTINPWLKHTPSETSDLHAETQIQVLCGVHVQTTLFKKQERQSGNSAIQFWQDRNVLFADKGAVKLLACKYESTSPWCTCLDLILRLDIPIK